MLTIPIIAGNISASPIIYNNKNGGSIEGLPKKLSHRLTQVVIALNNRGVVKLEYGERHFVLSQGAKNYDLSTVPLFLGETLLVELLDVIKLLHWYFEPHLKAREPGLLGGQVYCCECGLTQHGATSTSTYCEFVGCSSHAKWEKIIDGYEPPKYLSNEAL